MATTHAIKVQQPYFEAIWDGRKTFEVRKNDRAYQRGDLLDLHEFDPSKCKYHASRCQPGDAICPSFGRHLEAEVTYVYSGDPRFGGIEPGYVVLGIGARRKACS